MTIDLVLAYIGVFLLSVSGLPQIYKSIRYKKVNGLSPMSLSCVFLGCSCTLGFVLLTRGVSILMINYLLNAIFSFANLLLYFIYKKQ